MTITQRIYDNAVERIIANVPDNLTDMEKARYVYLALGRLFCFDEKYLLGKAKTEARIYRRAVSSSPSFSDIKEGRRKKAVCVSISRTYCAILREIGIEATSDCEDIEDKHEDTFFKIGGQPYKSDLTNDLKFIQLHLPTRYFAYSGAGAISKDELKSIDVRLGYTYAGEYFINNAIRQLSDELSDEKLLGNKVSRILETVSDIPDVDNLDFVERDSIYDFMLKKLLSPNDNPRFHKNTLYTQSGDDRKDFHVLYTSHDYDNESKKNVFRRFLYSNSDKKFVEVSDEELIDIIKSHNYRTHFAKRIPGLHGFGNKER